MAKNDEVLDAIDGIGHSLTEISGKLEEVKDTLSEHAISSDVGSADSEISDDVRELRGDLESLSDLVLTLTERLIFVGDALTEIMKLIQPQYKPFVAGVTKAGARALIRGLKFRRFLCPVTQLKR